eukprot:TRINITY_DN2240_c0_g1_i5.p1 TRINITY_DN2240_c0_g1~~TRINITY_DN2240_c0_g1_i5.p1  ORF type:complete len:110 (+),score=4.82 TRINITY_DN2240_c0_g1_i5:149-478(+)
MFILDHLDIVHSSCQERVKGGLAATQEDADSCCQRVSAVPASHLDRLLSAKDEVIEALRTVVNPDSGRDIISLGWVTDIHVSSEEKEKEGGASLPYSDAPVVAVPCTLR